MISLNLNHLKIVLLFLLIPFYANSQNKVDTTSAKTPVINEDFSFLMLNASYTNNNLEYLTGVTENIPIVFTNLSYVNKTGIYVGGSYANYFNANTQTYDYSIDVGYQKYFDKGLDIDLYYAKHGFSGDTLLEGLIYDHSLNASMGVDIKKFYLSADFSYLVMSKDNNSFLNINLSRSIQVNKVLFKNDVLLINPTISLTFGTDYWIYDDMTDLEKSETALSLQSNGFSYNTFSYEGIDLFIPVSYGINNTYLSLSWLYRIPGDKYKLLGWENQSGFMISITQFLNFSKK